MRQDFLTDRVVGIDPRRCRRPRGLVIHELFSHKWRLIDRAGSPKETIYLY